MLKKTLLIQSGNIWILTKLPISLKDVAMLWKVLKMKHKKKIENITMILNLHQHLALKYN